MLCLLNATGKKVRHHLLLLSYLRMAVLFPACLEN
jgi:hypothetical protein